RLAAVVREEDPEALVTYVNYPSTEYLDLPFVDVVGFNVYLESTERFEAYLPRLQNLAGERPLLITELGLDSLRGGLDAQAALVDCLDGLRGLEYPDFETIVVDDGSTDAVGRIAEEFGVRVIRTQNRGLSAARNTGWKAASGEIVAYTDDDARPDPHWLHYLAWGFRTTAHAAIGGPNIAPPGDGWIAECVANAPGGPMHVLISDADAEHIPGCNMAFRRSALEAVGGFDPRFRTAGDDVDLC